MVKPITADDWNALHPVGTRVLHRPIEGGVGMGRAKTCSAAWQARYSGGALVMLKVGVIEAAVALDELEVLEKETA